MGSQALDTTQRLSKHSGWAGGHWHVEIAVRDARAAKGRIRPSPVPGARNPGRPSFSFCSEEGGQRPGCQLSRPSGQSQENLVWRWELLGRVWLALWLGGSGRRMDGGLGSPEGCAPWRPLGRGGGGGPGALPIRTPHTAHTWSGLDLLLRRLQGAWVMQANKIGLINSPWHAGLLQPAEVTFLLWFIASLWVNNTVYWVLPACLSTSPPFLGADTDQNVSLEGCGGGERGAEGVCGWDLSFWALLKRHVYMYYVCMYVFSLWDVIYSTSHPGPCLNCPD